MADPTPQPIRVAAGQAKRLVIMMDPVESIAGQTARFRLRVPGAVVEKAMGDGVTIADGPGGVWHVDLDPDDTLAVARGLYPWSFWDVDSGEESPIAYGTCEIYRTAETG